MKRLKFLLAGIASSVIISAQTEFDALKYLQPDITGTARYSSMAGAFGALGADASAIKDNPAGLGIYRSSEFSVTYNTLSQSTQSEWRSNSAKDGLFVGTLNQLAFVLSGTPTIAKNSLLKRSNWAFNYHRIKDFNRQVRINGGSGVAGSALDYIAYFTADIPGSELFETNTYNPYNNTSVPWLSVTAANAGLINEFVYDDTNETAYWAPILDKNETVSPEYYLRESGHFDEYSLSWSGNLNNKLFIGATVNFYDLNYTVKSEYIESFSVVGSMSLKNYLSSNASGVGVRLGAIYIPLDYLRLGASVKSPMVLTNKDIHYVDVYYNHGGSDFGTIFSPEGDNIYKLQSPMVVNLSAALIQGKKGVIGIEYVNSSNKTAKFMDSANNSFNYRLENDSMGVVFNTQHTLKIGGEYKLNDNFSLRAGYAYISAPANKRLSKEMNSNTLRTDIEYFVPGTTSYFTGGLGYRESVWAFDLAVVNKLYSEDFYAYNPSKVGSSYRMPAAKASTSNISLLATVGLRF